MSHPDGGLGGASAGAGGDDQLYVVPERSTVDVFAHQGGCREGVAVESLDAGTTIVVCTRNSRYRLTVLDGVDSRVLVEGGSLFPTPTGALLQGASSGGNLLKPGWIGVGLRLELSVGRRRIITSPVSSVTIENLPPLL